MKEEKMDDKELSSNEIQAETFSLFLELQKLLVENKWQYYLAYGTLLGAVRHQGYIPWDDDFDIFMPRKDYEEFINYCFTHEEELHPFKIFHYKSVKNYVYPIARFCNTEYRIKYEHVKDYGLGLFIDIYPLDNCPCFPKRLFRKIRRKNKFIKFLGNDYVGGRSKVKKKIMSIIHDILVKGVNLNKLIASVDEIGKKSDKIPSDYWSCLIWDQNSLIFSKNDFEPNKVLLFNQVNVNVPFNYDKLLKMWYGDYMTLPPVKDRYGHHFYKAYKKQ